jgi:hypothetical protein
MPHDMQDRITAEKDRCKAALTAPSKLQAAE